MKRWWLAALASLPLILVVAVAFRLVSLADYAAQNPHQALGVLPFLFESGNIATSLATGHGFSSPFRVPTGPTAWMTPVYPFLLAGIFRIWGTYTFASFLAASLVNILFATLASIPIYFAGKRIGGKGVAASAAWLWAVFPNAILLTFESMWGACLAALLAATILWATLALESNSGPRFSKGTASAVPKRRLRVGASAPEGARPEVLESPLDRSSRWRDWCAYGLLWGLMLMTNPTLASVLPFLLGWLAYRAWRLERRAQPQVAQASACVPRRRRRSPEFSFLRNPLAGPALALGIAFLCCVPWTIRNYRAFHALVPLRSVLGLQLWLGNNPQAQPIWRARLHPINNEAQRAEYIRLGEIAYTNHKFREAIRYMATHPSRVAHLAARRFLAIWSGGTPYPLRDFLASRSLWFRYVLLFNLVAALGAAAGIVILFRRRHPCALPLAVFPIVFPWAYYLTLAEPRYSLPIDPMVMLLLAVALSSLYGVGATSSGRTSRSTLAANSSSATSSS